MKWIINKKFKTCNTSPSLLRFTRLVANSTRSTFKPKSDYGYSHLRSFWLGCSARRNSHSQAILQSANFLCFPNHQLRGTFCATQSQKYKLKRQTAGTNIPANENSSCYAKLRSCFCLRPSKTVYITRNDVIHGLRYLKAHKTRLERSEHSNRI